MGQTFFMRKCHEYFSGCCFLTEQVALKYSNYSNMELSMNKGRCLNVRGR